MTLLLTRKQVPDGINGAKKGLETNNFQSNDIIIDFQLSMLQIFHKIVSKIIFETLIYICLEY